MKFHINEHNSLQYCSEQSKELTIHRIFLYTMRRTRLLADCLLSKSVEHRTLESLETLAIVTSGANIKDRLS